MKVSDDKLIETLSAHIREKIGIYFPPKKYGELRYKLIEAAKEKGFKKLTDFVEAIVNEKDNRKQVEVLASKLTIGETYFWRDRELFRALEEFIVPNLIETKTKSRKTLRIWSAGSASGEEAYSIAILLKRLIPDISNWNISILATDINHESLKKAQKGTYTDWSFRSAPPWLKENYFNRKADNHFELEDGIKRMVSFNYLNLAQDSYPSLLNNTNGMDLIFCRNVLMYFALEDINTITEKFYNCLVNDGCLFTTPSESFQYISPRFKLNHVKNVSFYQRSIQKEEVKQTSGKSKEIPDLDEIIQKENVRSKRKAKRIQFNREQKKKLDQEKQKKPDFDSAYAYYEAGYFDEAEDMLKLLINGKPKQEDVLLMARIKANLGKLDEALNYCRDSLLINKLNPDSYYLLAMIESEMGQYEHAYISLRKSFYLDPHKIITNFNLGTLALQLKKVKEANKHFQNTSDLLENMEREDTVPDSDGMTAGRLKEIINTSITNT